MDAAASPDTSGIRIEPIAAVHIDSFHRTLDVVAREKKYLSMLEASPLPQTREFVMGMIAKGNPQFVATAEGEVVGWCDISRHFFPSHAHRGRLGMGVLPAYRGRGLGRRLVQTTLKAAQETGFVRVELDVYEDNARAIALYEKVGFAREGIVRRAACIDGRFIDAISMALLFDERGFS
ncbi:GNAT family N-acetyltransferase [Rhizobium leguminosarum bv. viciae]|uniref:GNAT family N-acetyltransferase n=1 Tax=Rhizobium leguminosarum bv. viciae TaxID=387 RepID=A0A4R0BM13_RHILV|nr:GNAT family N-acetyltransferase [Rhizobium leguminosarum]MBY5791280.1 GNAT family N-acetyltransferase [Rhizobium leguminosarum]NKL99007.1 GNAT family N-acetyltransferase [Rhizobium leguminosarum bv. viciae]NKM46439.1 GNAT family N-acetyltransferase [Rhizobium leguminosarum bv. viciae]TBY77189.1 GNAT family N-acetyltransferase [Rhizobium leguminosarum bv. viciae]TBZ14267.1 GNAT family N-acetyltransferase [Rhizobium leguminosarum bv. viciae]